MGARAVAIAVALVTVATTSRAQDTLPPTQGGYVHSLGLPEIYKPYVGVGIGLSNSDGHHLASQARLGVFRDVGNPITEALGWDVEGYAGLRDVRVDGGVRGQLVCNLFRIGAGVDYGVHDGADFMLTYAASGRRGGLIGGGSELRLEWLPTRHGSFNVAINVPLRQPHRGHTRVDRPYVVLHADRPRPVVAPTDNPSLAPTLESLRETALWINRLTVPKLGASGDNPADAAAAAVGPLKAHLAGRVVADDIEAYHRLLARAFSIAMSDSSGALGAAVAQRARAILLDRVLFPYNRLIGQAKREDTTREFGGHARGVFARWLVSQSAIPAQGMEAALYVFQRLLDIVEEVRAANRSAWGDSRLVWLPLQLALEPEQYDEQPELDTLISHAVGQPITHGNRAWYVHNSRFQVEMIKSIGKAAEYHVLWIHDFRGLNDSGQPDRLSLLVVTDAYLKALTDRVARYDSTGTLPAYMIFLDQHYFEVNRSRDLLNVLQDPLGRTLDLPLGDSLGDSLRAAQVRLWHAVTASRLLTAERAQYGERWLHRLVKVHVNITNPADPSFRSRQILPIIGMPDDAIRDHRKVVLYDVSEEDPYRGMAMYAGMGVGEHYAGPAWEDRALMVQGPAALTLRDEARRLLETQGIEGGEMPQVLRPRRRAPDYDIRVQREIDSLDAKGEVASRAIDLHNGTGFDYKELSVAEATVFNLMSPGGVVKVPDSLWLNELLASLLVGGALRGVRVLVIAPALASAPASSWQNIAAIHDLMSRLVALHGVLAPDVARAGGLLRVGLYAPSIDVDDLRDRVTALKKSLAKDSVLRDLYAFDSAAYRVLDSADAILAGAGLPPRDSAILNQVMEAGQPTTPLVRPKLHFKGFLYVSGEAWTHLISGAPMAPGMQVYLEERARQLREGPRVSEDPMADAMQKVGALAINPVLANIPPGTRYHWVFFLMVGSANQDYRSMAMDGEAALLVSNWTTLYAVPDFVLLTGLVTWVDDQAELDRLLPPPGAFKRWIARWIRMAL
jgi:phosphatidylserine/phosphatidylglycerophosphate/cardiolipin synthase-like enzyme